VKKPYNISEKARLGWAKAAKKGRETRIKRDNYRHTEFTKTKLREATARAIAEGRVHTSSKLEEKVIPVLDSMGIAYVHQFAIRNNSGRYACVFDFFIPIHKIAIEVNGTFFHSDPRFYPNGPVHAIQKRNAIKWSVKLNIIRQLGYTLVQLWENDIKERGQEYIRQSLLAVI